MTVTLACGSAVRRNSASPATSAPADADGDAAGLVDAERGGAVGDALLDGSALTNGTALAKGSTLALGAAASAFTLAEAGALVLGDTLADPDPAGPGREPTHPMTPTNAATDAAIAHGNGLRDPAAGALEGGIARVAGSSVSTTEGGLDGSVVCSASALAAGGMLAILRVHSTKSSRAAKVRVIGAPPAGVAGVSGGMGGVAGVCGGGRLDSNACGEAAGVSGPLPSPGNHGTELGPRWRARRTRAPSRLATSPLSN